ncbi:hypothetical protein O0L34_g15369 [Tuta absoluta]|nr:hypothetical protein O0L34_g15369 [Tuta absoluta]
MNETNEGQSIHEIIIDEDDSDDEVVICEQYEIIEVDDDDSNGESSSTRNPQPAPKTMLQPEVPTNQQFAEEAKRIPIDKVTVELLCEYLGVDFKPEWSLEHIRKIFKDRTRMHKNTPEIQDAIARKALWCRRIVIKFLPNWFQIYHVITLIRLLSSFDVNKPTYRVQVTQAGKKNKLRKLDRENSNRCYIDFLYIEDCRQLLYDLQGLQCFKHNIPVNSSFGMMHKSKPNSMLNALTRIKEFRLDQGNWCPITEGMVEIHDSEENSSQSYSFPLLADIQNNFKERIDPVLKVSKQNEKKTMSFVKTSKEKVGPDTDNCRTVVMDKIPITWGKFHIHNLIRDIFSQKMEFHTSILDENNDNTVKYLVKFATHAQAAKVCTALNGFFIENKKLQVRFERGQDFDETLSALAKKLVSGASPENCQSRRIKQSPLLPTTR